jgi:hypothetical protein
MASGNKIVQSIAALFGVAFGGALALGALSFMTAVGWAGATF